MQQTYKICIGVNNCVDLTWNDPNGRKGHIIVIDPMFLVLVILLFWVFVSQNPYYKK